MCQNFCARRNSRHKLSLQRSLAIFIAVGLSAPALAQPAPPPNPSTWTLIGPIRTHWPFPAFGGVRETSGRVRSIVIDPSGTIYVGGEVGGVWKRTGSSWIPLTDFQPSLAIGAIAIDPSDPNTIYIGTGDSGGITSYYGTGILKSRDGGTTWTSIIGPFLNDIENYRNVGDGRLSGGARIHALAVSPTNPNVLLAVVQMRLYVLTDSGIYRSADGGLSWMPALTGGGGGNSTIVFDPTNGNIAYAAIGDYLFGAQGVYKSIDAGRTWNRLSGTPPNVLPTTSVGTMRLAISRSNPLTLYVGIADLGFSTPANLGHLLGLYKTTDGGANWALLGSVPDYCASFCNDVNEIAIHPSNPNIVLLGGAEHPVYRTLNGGASWDEISGSDPSRLHPDVRAIAFSPDGTTAYVGNDGGISSSTTYSTSGTWTLMNDNLAITQFYGGFDVDPLDIDHAFAGTQDNAYQVFSGSLAWNVTCLGGEGGNVQYDLSGNTAYLAGQTMMPRGCSATGIGLPGLRIPTAPFAIDRRNPAVQYTGSNRIYQTTNYQRLWVPISPVLTGSVFASISAIAVAFHNPDIVCAGTSDGQVWCTANASAGTASTWTNYSLGIPNRRYVTKIAINHFKEYIISVSFSGFTGAPDDLGPGDTQGHVFLSTTGGAAWTDISGNLPNSPVNDVIIDDLDIDQLYVATNVGVFRTFDRGITWAPLANGLPHTVASGLFLHQPSRTLYSGTMGRSMWRLSVPYLTAAPGPTIGLNPWLMRFSAHFGGPNPPTQPLQVINAGSSLYGTTTLNWTATASTAFGGAWLATTPITGIDTAATNVSVDVTGLPLGLYNGLVRVSDPASTNTPQDLTVLLAVTDSPPSASAGAAISTDATTPAGAAVTLNGLGSTDPDNDPLTYSWIGPFGKTTGVTPTVQVPIGTYTVTLTVADPAGLTSSATVKVTVFSPAQMTSALIAVVENFGFQQAVDLLNSALAKIQGGDTVAACNKLRALENQVQAQSGKQLSAAQATLLLTSANHIVGALGCQ